MLGNRGWRTAGVVRWGLSHSLLRVWKKGLYNASSPWQETTAPADNTVTTCCAASVVFLSAADLVGSRVTLLFYFLSLCVVMIYVCLFDILTSSEFRIADFCVVKQGLVVIVIQWSAPQFASSRSENGVEVYHLTRLRHHHLPCIYSGSNYLLLHDNCLLFFVLEFAIMLVHFNTLIYLLATQCNSCGHVVQICRW
jgi:hypothetical protein